MYGTQTDRIHTEKAGGFENDVKMYGTQTSMSWGEEQQKFENDVNVWYSN